MALLQRLWKWRQLLQARQRGRGASPCSDLLFESAHSLTIGIFDLEHVSSLLFSRNAAELELCHGTHKDHCRQPSKSVLAGIEAMEPVNQHTRKDVECRFLVHLSRHFPFRCGCVMHEASHILLRRSSRMSCFSSLLSQTRHEHHSIVICKGSCRNHR